MSILIIGTGVAGLTAALTAHERGLEVTVVTKAQLLDSNTRWAQGGVAAVTSPEDSVASHVADSLEAGAGIAYEPTVEILCAEGPAAVANLIRHGVKFDMKDGELARGLEAAHSFKRILHAGGDATGAAIANGLANAVREAAIDVRENTMVTDLIVRDSRVVGVRTLDGAELLADAVVLATGGAGQVFPYTTNPTVATADGLAMALRAGAVAADVEFYQFHPTSLAAPGNHLISEAVRGEGAVLLDRDGKRFMLDVHPDAELAPRDVVARGIAAQMAKQDGEPVRLDATALGAEFLARRFPNIDTAVRSQGFDWANEPLPVTPAAHYFMGGVRSDEYGRTSLPGLFAVGEVACNGLHGANRLASNSLLEGAVYGIRVIEAITRPEVQPEFDDTWAEPMLLPAVAGSKPSLERADLQLLMWDAAGLVREAHGLTAALDTLAEATPPTVWDVASAEDANLAVVSRAMVASALARESSRGGHFRSDFPEADPAFAHHSAIRLEVG